MFKLEFTAEGKTRSDLELAVDELKKKVEGGYLCGCDSNDSGEYTFAINEKEES